jgi:hypothetical protein
LQSTAATKSATALQRQRSVRGNIHAAARTKKALASSWMQAIQYSVVNAIGLAANKPVAIHAALRPTPNRCTNK